jgi:hypothetical protein
MWALCCSTTDLVHPAMLNHAGGLAISAADLAGVHITFGQDDTRVDSRAGLIDIHGGHQAVGIITLAAAAAPAIDTIIESTGNIFSLRSHSDSCPVRRGYHRFDEVDGIFFGAALQDRAISGPRRLLDRCRFSDSLMGGIV